jgi:DNA-binding response OmpR family regulator
MAKHRILIIEDNPDTRRFLEIMLGKEFEILMAENAVIGVDYARNRAPDLILLDVMLPMLSGFDACALLRKDEKTKRIPVIFLSAKNTVGDITQGLGSGADDYVAKPFDYKELVARIRARLRKDADATAQPLQLGDLRIDPGTRSVTFAGKLVKLTLTEFDILRCLAARAGDVVSREDILKDVWQEESKEANNRTIDVHVRALRRKMPALTKFLISIYGVGYKYEK